MERVICRRPGEYLDLSTTEIDLKNPEDPRKIAVTPTSEKKNPHKTDVKNSQGFKQSREKDY